MKLRQFKFRALIRLDPAGPGPSLLHPPASEYPNHTRSLMIRAHLGHDVGGCRYFETEIWWDGVAPLRPGDQAVVTLTVTDEDAAAFLATGPRFALWSGGDVGQGTISRRVFTEHGPS